ncbi:carbohydrate porin, partial [Arthrospira platensis SPKY1]|nr:carbohydrate porin [Arthrospira platensis SPKY1]
PRFQFVNTLAFKYQGNKNNYTTAADDGTDLLIREAYIRADNVLTNAPGVAFWAGQRFYDRHDIHINDFFYLDMSGFGGGVENIPAGPGTLDIAYIMGTQTE